MVYDRERHENKEWQLTGVWPYWDVPNDYAIITGVLDTTTDRPVVIAAGITQYDTMVAGECLSNPRYSSEALRQLPPDWKRKNLQLVLLVPVVKRVLGCARVLATQVP